MMMMKKMAAACAAAAMIVTMGAANAQMAPQTSYPSGPPAGYPSGQQMGSPMTTPGSAMSPGSAMTTTQTTQQTSTGGYGADDYSADNSTLPNTGGEPLLMMMAGTLLAGSAFALRRKLS